jgi:hypothetical protein
MKIKAALLIDNLQIEKWQQQALHNASDLLDIKVILNCQNTIIKRNLFKHFFYYLLNLISIQTRLNKKINFDSKNIKLKNFKSSYQGIWQSIPESIIQELKSKEINVIIKFGMNLLDISDHLNALDVLSFHHGDPSQYRGRPAGFYEIFNSSSSIGLVVQLLSNKLDGGAIAAKGFSKIYFYSYHKSLLGVYQNSIYLFRKAIVNYQNGDIVHQTSLGKNYSLPSNLLTIKFILKIVHNKIKRIFKAFFYEKKWNIALFNSRLDILKDHSVPLIDAKIPHISKEYSFYADPFFSPEGRTIRIEAMRKRTGMGEIIELDSKNLKIQKIILKGIHFSYPFSFEHNGDEFLFPEVADHSKARIYKKYLDEFPDYSLINGLEELSITDPTLIKFKDFFYLFCNHLNSPNDRLHLYYSESFSGKFLPHPLNPIVLDPLSARMAGNIVLLEGKLYRLGQDNTHHYGKQIVVNEIMQLTPSIYEERMVNMISCSKENGPHTLNFYKHNSVIDFYEEKFSLTAGINRISQLFFKGSV